MKRLTCDRLVCALLMLSLAAPASAQDNGRDWATLAASLAPGTRIELDLADGTHVEGTVLGQEKDRFVFNPRTRIPVEPWRIDYSEIRSLDIKKDGDGMRPGIKVLLSVGVGFAVTMLIAVIALAAAY